jgi:hypothetical protein
MVRKVRLGSDDTRADLDPSPRHADFDDLDDLVLDPVPDRPKGGERSERKASARRSTSPRPETDRRHLADADWINDPAG